MSAHGGHFATARMSLAGADWNPSTVGVVILRGRPLLRGAATPAAPLDVDPGYARSYAVLAQTYVAAWYNRLDADFLNPGALD